jgi:8-oxo-dGTP diphosphatase
MHLPTNRAGLRRLALLLQKAPFLTHLLIRVFRVSRARFTAGVVGVVMNDENEMLLVKHVFHPEPSWGLPGGWMERRERPEVALVRELKEELGLEVTVEQPLVIETGYLYPSHLDVAYLCRAQGPVQHLSIELLEYRWIAIEDVPPLFPFHRVAVEAAAQRIVRG